MGVYKRLYSESSLKEEHIHARQAVSPTWRTEPDVTASKMEHCALGFWLIVSILVYAGGATRLLNRAINEGGGAHFALCARAFARDGVIALRGVPLQNNLPAGTEPDWYIHWPPLYDIVLGFAFRFFGESAATAHAVSFGVIMIIAAGLYAAVSSCLGRRAGCWATFALFVLAPTYKFGYFVIPLELALAFMVLSLWSFSVSSKNEILRPSYAWLGAAFLCLAVLTSWEPLLMPLGLACCAAWVGDRTRLKLALAYMAAAGVTFFVIIGFYFWNAPQLAAELVGVALFRIGFKYGISPPVRIHSLADNLLYGSTPRPNAVQLLMQYGNNLYMLGPIAIVALAGVLTWIFLQRRTPKGRQIGTLVLGLLSSWVLWAIFMPNHAYIHGFEVIFATPGTAAALGIALHFLLRWSESFAFSTRKVMVVLLLCIVPGVLIVGMVREIVTLPPFREDPKFYQHFGIAIGRNTPEGAVILIAAESRDPAYYSKRHVIRGVASDNVLENIQFRLSSVFPGAPLYLALQADDVSKFPVALQRDPVLVNTSELILLSLGNERVHR